MFSNFVLHFCCLISVLYVCSSVMYLFPSFVVLSLIRTFVELYLIRVFVACIRFVLLVYWICVVLYCTCSDTFVTLYQCTYFVLFGLYLCYIFYCTVQYITCFVVKVSSRMGSLWGPGKSWEANTYRGLQETDRVTWYFLPRDFS